jgi:hypothetical protein
MPVNPARWSLVFAAAVALFPCGTPSQTTQAAVPAADACALFTQSQVSSVLGITVSHGQYPIASSLLLCNWTPVGEPQLQGKRLSVSLMTERAFEVAKVPVQGASTELLKGLADDAYYSAAGGVDSALSIKKGNTYVQIRVGGFSAGKDKQLEKVLALQLLPEL